MNKTTNFVLLLLWQINGNGGIKFPMWVCVAVVVLVAAVRVIAEKVLSRRNGRPGSVADLVRRGQLRSDRRGMYDFNPYPLLSTYFNSYALFLHYC